MASDETRTRRFSRAEYERLIDLVDRVLEVYREPASDAAAPFGWRFARREVFDTSARVTPLAALGSSIPVSQLLP